MSTIFPDHAFAAFSRRVDEIRRDLKKKAVRRARLARMAEKARAMRAAAGATPRVKRNPLEKAAWKRKYHHAYYMRKRRAIQIDVTRRAMIACGLDPTKQDPEEYLNRMGPWGHQSWRNRGGGGRRGTQDQEFY